MTWVVCWAIHDTPPKRDASCVFIPEAALFMEALEAAGKKYLMVEIDNHLPYARRADELLDVLGSLRDLEGLIYLGHGLWQSLPSLGVGMVGRDKGRLGKLVGTIAKAAADDSPVVGWFACSTADGPGKGVAVDGPGMDGGLADATRDLLCLSGCVNCRVLAHTTSGHAAKNPDLAVFEGLGSPVGGVGGRLLVPFGSPLRGRWKRALADPSKKPSFRHRLPLMDPEEMIRKVSR